MIYRSFVVPRWQADNAALKAEIKDETADKADKTDAADAADGEWLYPHMCAANRNGWDTDGI